MLTCLLTLSALAAAPPRYATRQLILEVDSTELDHLRALTRASLADKRIDQVLARRNGVLEPVAVEQMNHAVTAAVLATLASDGRNAEHDLVFPEGDAFVPVSVWWLPDPWRLELQVGAPLPQAPAAPASRADLDALQVGPLIEEDRRWSAASMGLVAEAWSLLTPHERALLADLPLHRRSVPTAEELAQVGRGPGTQLEAIYREDSEGARIVVFDEALTPTGLFCGDPDAPRFAGLLTVLHELAHALATVESRRERAAFEALTDEVQLAIAAYNADVDRYNAGVANKNTPAQLEPLARRLTEQEAALEVLTRRQRAAAEEVNARNARDTPMAAAWRARFGALAVTWYATDSLEEAVAEAFSLARADPDALRRISPEALAWFTEGGHLLGQSAPSPTVTSQPASP